MKDLVLRKPFGTRDLFFIERAEGDTDEYVLSYIDEQLGIKLSIKEGGDTDGGSIPSLLKGAFDPLLDKTAHGFIFHDELWRHRYVYQDLFAAHGITFTQTNRIMKEIHDQAGCGWFARNFTRLGVRYGGYWKWTHPSDAIKEVETPTLFIEKVER